MKHPMQCAKCFRVCRLSDSGKTWVCTICKHREKANGGKAVSDEQITAEATPAGELRRQILSQCVAKNEREWWAARTIEKLEFELNAANDRIKRLEDAGDFLSRYLREMPYASDYLAQVDERILRISNWRRAKEDNL